MLDQYILVATPFLRALAGWGQNAFADGKVDWPEWRRLGETAVKYLVPSLALYYGLEFSAEFTAGLVVLTDIAMHWVKRLLAAQAVAEAEAQLAVAVATK